MINRRAVATQLVALPFASMLGAATQPLKKPIIGQPAPEFTLKMLDGSIVRLSERRGRVVLLNFWATWCASCRTELPLLNAYYQVRRDAGFDVFAITTEGSVPISQLKKFLNKLAMPSARSIKGPYGPIKGSVPTNFVIGRDGVLQYAKAGAFKLTGLDKLMVPLFNQKV